MKGRQLIFVRYVNDIKIKDEQENSLYSTKNITFNNFQIKNKTVILRGFTCYYFCHSNTKY